MSYSSEDPTYATRFCLMCGFLEFPPHISLSFLVFLWTQCCRVIRSHNSNSWNENTLLKKWILVPAEVYLASSTSRRPPRPARARVGLGVFDVASRVNLVSDLDVGEEKSWHNSKNISHHSKSFWTFSSNTYFWFLEITAVSFFTSLSMCFIIIILLPGHFPHHISEMFEI